MNITVNLEILVDKVFSVSRIIDILANIMFSICDPLGENPALPANIEFELSVISFGMMPGSATIKTIISSKSQAGQRNMGTHCYGYLGSSLLAVPCICFSISSLAAEVDAPSTGRSGDLFSQQTIDMIAATIAI